MINQKRTEKLFRYSLIWHSRKNSVTQTPGGLEVLSFGGKNIEIKGSVAIFKGNLHFSSPGSQEITIFSGPVKLVLSIWNGV